MAHPVWQISLTLPVEHVAPMIDWLDGFTQGASAFATDDLAIWQVCGYTQRKPDQTALDAALTKIYADIPKADRPVLAVEEMPKINWLTKVTQSYEVIETGRLAVFSKYADKRPKPNQHGIMVDAATAFGSGEHATTYGCLYFLDQLAKQFPNLRHGLDMGCGSGVLALAMAKLWPMQIIASDCDPEAVRVAQLNTKLNHLTAQVRVVGGDGYIQPLVKQHRPYDLIAANILARPLTKMAVSQFAHLAKNGHLILSGILTPQAPMVISAYRMQGLILRQKFTKGEWTSLLFHKRTIPCQNP